MREWHTSHQCNVKQKLEQQRSVRHGHICQAGIKSLHSVLRTLLLGQPPDAALRLRTAPHSILTKIWSSTDLLHLGRLADKLSNVRSKLLAMIDGGTELRNNLMYTARRQVKPSIEFCYAIQQSRSGKLGHGFRYSFFFSASVYGPASFVMSFFFLFALA